MITFKYDEAKREFRISFPFSTDILETVKTITGRKWDAESKEWVVPVFSSIKILQFIQKWRKLCDDQTVLMVKEKIIENKNKLELSGSTDVVESIRKFETYIAPDGREYYPFQKVAIEWIEHNEGNALIADEMGCGKTIEVLGWLNQHPEVRPVTIVCPASVKLNWKKEIERWVVNCGKVTVLKNKVVDYDSDFYIINYDIAKNFVDTRKKKEIKEGIKANPNYNDSLAKSKIKCLVMDEAHYLKEKKTQRTKAVLTMAKHIPYRIALSGTPILNRPAEMFNVLHLLSPEIFDNWYFYVNRYCNAKNDGFGMKIDGHKNEYELNQKLKSSIMLRRMKEDVLKELPSKTRIFVPLDAEQSKEYAEIERKIINECNYQTTVSKNQMSRDLLDESKSLVLSEITQARQEIFNFKKEKVVEFILDTLELEEHIVVFCYHKNSVRYITEALLAKKISVTGFTGEDNINKRQDAIENFQKGIYRVFITTTGAGSEGITLTRSNTVIFSELDWSLAKTIQAEDRTHRIGQENNVSIYFLIAFNSIEGYMANLLEEKMKVFKSVVDGESFEDKHAFFRDLNEWALLAMRKK